MTDEITNPIEDIGYHSFYLESFFNEKRLTNATCFCYKKNEEYYLVTNYHILSGREPNPDMNGLYQPIDKTNGAIPNKIRVWIYGWEYPLENGLVRTGMGYFFDIPILNQHEEPLYKFKQFHDNGFYDVAILPLKNIDFLSPQPDSFSFGKNRPVPANRSLGGLAYSYNLRPTDDVFILGYPFGQLKPHSYLPIWKRGSVATSLKYSPYFLVDTATRSGMSGSPVYAISSNEINQLLIAKQVIPNEKPYKAKFIGIYSGRIVSPEERTSDGFFKVAGHDIDTHAQLGKVWKKEIIEKIIDDILL
ncbi:MAG: serine protease [Elusimicrobium sp.]|jgi:hypothetical protein|nr:serine protease [Elusimicrobium sp.]